MYQFDQAIRLSHVDQINQTAGRNLGFRQQQGTNPLHYLIIGDALWDTLWSVLRDECRYGLVEFEDSDTRRKRAFSAGRSSARAAQRSSEEVVEVAAEHGSRPDVFLDAEIDALSDAHRAEVGDPDGCDLVDVA